MNNIDNNELMTLEDAIQHCLEVAKTESCIKCAEEHLQLARWLNELNMRREGKL